MRTAISVLTASAGLTLVIVAVSIGLTHHPAAPRDFGTIAEPPPSSVTVLRAPARPHTAARPVTLSRPTQLGIPALDVHANVVPVAASAGLLDVPADPAQVGWWTAGALPGAGTGATVIDGHVDSAATGPGALFRLTDLRAGDRIEVTTATGAHISYVVTGRRAYVKARGLPASLFATSGPHRLVLITCGGPFDRDRQLRRQHRRFRHARTKSGRPINADAHEP